MAERAIKPGLGGKVREQLLQMPETGTRECLAVVKGLGIALLPETSMVLLHEANSIGDRDLVEVLQKRLLGEGGVGGVYKNGVANPYIEEMARRRGMRDPDAIADFRQECHQRMVRHILATQGQSLMWETGFRVALAAVSTDVWRYFGRRGRARHPAAHPLTDSLDAASTIGYDFWAVAEREEVHAALHRAIEMLPRNEAEAIRRKDLGGESYVAIAQYLGMTEGAIRARRESGIRKLGLDLNVLFADHGQTEHPR